MFAFLLLVSLLLNGNFAQGLAHWQADPGWSASKGVAQLSIDNRAGTGTRGANLCSDVYAVARSQVLRGSADVWQRKAAQGYVFVGVRWYDAHGAPLWTEMLTSNEGTSNRVWHNLKFETVVPDGAAQASFCFFAGGYEGQVYRAQADNATMR